MSPFPPGGQPSPAPPKAVETVPTTIFLHFRRKPWLPFSVPQNFPGVPCTLQAAAGTPIPAPPLPSGPGGPVSVNTEPPPGSRSQSWPQCLGHVWENVPFGPYGRAGQSWRCGPRPHQALGSAIAKAGAEWLIFAPSDLPCPFLPGVLLCCVAHTATTFNSFCLGSQVLRREEFPLREVAQHGLHPRNYADPH